MPNVPKPPIENIDDAGSSAATAAVGDIVAIRPHEMSVRSMR